MSNIQVLLRSEHQQHVTTPTAHQTSACEAFVNMPLSTTSSPISRQMFNVQARNVQVTEEIMVHRVS